MPEFIISLLPRASGCVEVHVEVQGLGVEAQVEAAFNMSRRRDMLD